MFMKMKIIISIFMILVLIFVSGLSVGAMSYLDTQSMENKRIHFINVGNGDAILLESNGHFAMVDVGEDTNYPDGSDPRYPLRPGITTTEGYEEKVINYLKSVGVKKLDFIIGTHAHSDHIGSMPNIMDEFKTEKLYAKVYSDKYIYSKDRLWDNQYVYDRMIEAAKRNKVKIIQDFNEKNTKFNFYGMSIEILNWEDKLNPDGTRKLLYDENEEALGLKICCGKQKLFLASDIQNTNGDEDRLASVIGKVDFLKIGHHGLGDKTNKNFIEALKPKQAVNCGVFDIISSYKLEALADVGATLFVTESFEDALIVGISASSVKIINDEQLQYNASEGNWYYYENEVKVKNAFKDIYHRFNYEKYYFQSNGRAIKGFFEANKKRYYADNDCIVKRGWTKINNDWYYMDNTGAIQTGLITVDGKSYYLNDNGIMQTGLLKINGDYYYFDVNNGDMQRGWTKINNDWYYMDSTGVIQTGLITVDGKSYYLNDNGIMQTGLLKINGDYYYFDVNNGDMQKGVCSLDDGIYYFNINSGKREAGWVNFENDLYYFDAKDYKAKIGWFSIDEKTYYAGKDGALKTGIQTIDGKEYYFNKKTGELELGFVEDNNKIYYFEKAGVLKKGWFMLESNWYYADEAGVIKTKWLYLNNNWYYMDELGRMKTGWVWDNAWYYMDKSGAMKTGWVWDNAWYYLYNSGEMAKDTYIDGYYLDASGRLI